jgi:hypothetical protein
MPNKCKYYFKVPLDPHTQKAVAERKQVLLLGKQSQREEHITIFEFFLNPRTKAKVDENALIHNISEHIVPQLGRLTLTHTTRDFDLFAPYSPLKTAFYAKQYGVDGPPINIIEKLNQKVMGNSNVLFDERYIYFQRPNELPFIAIPKFTIEMISGLGKFHITVLNFGDIKTHNSHSFQRILGNHDESKLVGELTEEEKKEMLSRILEEERGDNFQQFFPKDAKDSRDQTRARHNFLPFQNIFLRDLLNQVTVERGA